MKNGKKLQRWMKGLLISRGMNPSNFYYIKNLPGNLIVINSQSLNPQSLSYSESEVKFK